MKLDKNKDTIIAPISATIGGSVSLIRISGNQAISVSNKFLNGLDLHVAEGNKFFHCQIKNSSDEIIDDVVLLLYKSPNSYTGEDVIEISCHGNPFIVEQIIQQYLSSGCRMADPGEFTKRAFLNGKIDLLQAEAIADLISAKSQKSAKNSLLHVGGKISNLILSLKNELINTASLLTLNLDFSEEDFDIINHSKIEETLIQVQKTINALTNTYQYGRIINKGVEVIICGKPNVGKSSLMNALIKRDRVIVSSTPGTTRDTIHEDVVINNISVRYIDTAGIRLTKNHIETEGVNRSEAALDKADIILLVLDASEKPKADDHNLLARLTKTYKENLIIVVNKNDIQISYDFKKELNLIKQAVIKVSAKTGKHINKLEKEIVNKLKINSKIIGEEIFITNQRQYEVLSKASQALNKALEGIKSNYGFEFIAVDMKNAIDTLSEVTGEISTDDVLNNIFSKFCIGK